ncbi:YybS family protein [Clostridium botulinum]|nr:YybS family protein [Clostridium botulinum]
MYNRENKTKPVIEAGLMVSLMIILIMFNLYFPVISIFVSFVLPIPIAVLYLRQDYKTTLLAILVTGIITTMIRNPIIALGTTISFGTIGYLLGYCIKKQKSIFMTIMILTAGFLLSGILILLIQVLFIDKNVILKNINMMKESMKLTKEFYSKAGIPKEQLEQIDKMIALLKPDIMLKVLPLSLIIAAFLSALLNYAITKKVLTKLGYNNLKSLPHISKIYINVRLVTIAAIGLLIGIILQRKSIELGDYFFITSQFIFTTLLLIDGVSTFIYYMRNKYKISKGILIFILFITVFSLNLSAFYISLGLIDTIFDFRKLDSFRQYKNNKSGEL